MIWPPRRQNWECFLSSTGYLRKIFSAFGEIESISVSKFKQLISEERNTEGDLSPDADDDIAHDCFVSRFVHLVFSKKTSLKSVIAASDSAFYELTKAVAKVHQLPQITWQNRSTIIATLFDSSVLAVHFYTSYINCPIQWFAV